MALFSITCETCQARLKVRSLHALGQIVACPKCGSMVQVVAPPGWTAPAVPSPTATPVDERALPGTPEVGEEVAASASAEPTGGRSWRLWLPVGGLAAVAVLAGLWWMSAGKTPEAALAPVARAAADGPPDAESAVAHPQATTPAAAEQKGEETTAEGPDRGVGSATAAAAKPADSDEASKDAAERAVGSESSGAPPEPPLPAAEPETAEEAAVLQNESTLPAEARTAPAATEASPEPAVDPPAAPDEPAPKAAPAAEPAEEPAVPQRSLDVRTRLATPLPGLRFEGVALADVLATLSQLGGVPIVLDVQSVPDAGRIAGARISQDLRNTTVGAATAASVRPLGLEGVVSRSHVILVPRGMRPGRPVSRTYDLAELANAKDAADLAALRAFLIRLAGASGSPAVPDPASRLELRALPGGHRLVAEALQRLREAQEIDRPAEAGDSVLPPLGDRLSRPVTLTFAPPRPLTQVLKELEVESQARVLADWPALERAGVGPETAVTLKVHEQPLSRALDGLAESRGLGWAPIDEQTLLLTTAAGAEGLWQVRSYPAKAFGPAAQDSQPLELLVRARSSAKHWQAADAVPASWRDPASDKVLIVGPVGLHLELESLRAHGEPARAR